MLTGTEKAISLDKVREAAKVLEGVAQVTPLQYNQGLSEKHGANIHLKREDLQPVRSYKIRGAFNRINNLSDQEKQQGIVAASAGNHAQGVALACSTLGITGKIFMPVTTTAQKVNKVRSFGKSFTEVILMGDTFDDAYREALKVCQEDGKPFIHPFEDVKVIEGQGTIGLEILTQSTEPLDYLLLPVGGGGLSAGVGTVFSLLSPHTKLIGIEPKGAPALHTSLARGENIELDTIDKFVDGAAVHSIGELNFNICRQVLERVELVDEGKICTTVLELYNEEGIIVEPAGALATAALEQLGDEIKGKNVAVVISGGNNDIVRMAEIKERSMLYEGLKQYFMVNFPQRAGALREFVTRVLGPEDDICFFEYAKKTNRENGPAVIGIELKAKKDLPALLQRMDAFKFDYKLLNGDQKLFGLLV